jgi:hypothetical protein
MRIEGEGASNLFGARFHHIEFLNYDLGFNRGSCKVKQMPKVSYIRRNQKIELSIRGVLESSTLLNALTDQHMITVVNREKLEEKLL